MFTSFQRNRLHQADTTQHRKHQKLLHGLLHPFLSQDAIQRELQSIVSPLSGNLQLVSTGRMLQEAGETSVLQIEP